jgi:hypothetical protein
MATTANSAQNKTKPAAQGKKPSNAALIWKMVKFLVRNINVLKMIRAQEELHSLLIRANTELARLGTDHPLYEQRVNELNHGVIELMRARWYNDRASNPGAANSTRPQDWKRAFASVKESRRIGKELLAALETGSSQPVRLPEIGFASRGTEITYADDVPLVPEINPVVILQGSDYEMGYSMPPR